jgi:hypothetical protein
MVLTLRKRFSHQFEFLANYTLSKAIDGGQVAGINGTFFGTDPPVDPLNRKLEYGTSDLNQTHRFVGSAVYMPRFHVQSKGASEVVNGFNFSTIVTLTSGQPIEKWINSYPTGASAGIDGGLTGGLVTNTGGLTGGRALFIPRNPINLPNIYNVDFRIGREFQIRERLRLMLVGEAFNIFNHTNITDIGPNTTNSAALAYNYTAAGAGVSAGHTNACIVPNAAVPTVTQTTAPILGPRQWQVSARLTFSPKFVSERLKIRLSPLD